MTEVEKIGAQFTVDVTEITTPYLSDKYGGGLEATPPYMGDHRFAWATTGSPSSGTGTTGVSSKT
ncbi:hypothetical protein [Streptomyces sp. NPDC002516]